MLHFIYNPKSGQGKVLRTLNKLMRACTRQKITYVLHPTEYAGHCTKLVADLENEDVTDFAILGGDGTFHEALNGVTRFETTRFLLIPCGSGNDFAKSDRRLSVRPIKLLQCFFENKTRKIDYIQFNNGKRSINVAGLGLDTEVLLKARAMRRLTGSPRYFAALCRVLKHFHSYDIAVTANGVTKDYSVLLAAACNGKQIGGGLKVSPNSEIDDGKLRLVIITMPHKDNIWRILPVFATGHHLGKYYAEEILADGIKIVSDRAVELDGEIYRMDFDCRLVHAELTVYC